MGREVSVGRVDYLLSGILDAPVDEVTGEWCPLSETGARALCAYPASCLIDTERATIVDVAAATASSAGVASRPSRLHE